MKSGKIIHRAGILLATLALLLVGFRGELSTAQIKVEEFPYQRRLSKDEQKWINTQLERMRLEEKIGQLIMVTVPAAFFNIESEGFKELRSRVLENRIGGIVLGPGEVYEAVMLINRLQELARFPLLVAADFEAGAGMELRGATNFPWSMASGAAGDTALAERQSAVIAQEARAVGVNVLFAPVADLSYPTSSIINVRSYGDDPAQVAQFVSAFIRGAQTYGVMATVKYFPGYGRATISAGGGVPTLAVSRQELETNEFVPFRAAITNPVGGIMVGHIAVPQLDPTPLTSAEHPAAAAGSSSPRPATLSSAVLTDLLRKTMNFDGLIFTDSLQAGSIAGSVGGASAAVLAVKAGADILLSPLNVDEAIRALMDAVHRGQINQQRIDESVRRILTAKVRLGLAGNRFTDIDLIDNFISRGQNQQVAQSIARGSVTLVRNDRNLIPIKAGSIKSLFHLVITDADTNQPEQQALGSVLTSELQRKMVEAGRVVVDNCTPADRVSRIVGLARAAGGVVVSLFVHPRSDGHPIALPAAGAAILNQLLESGPPVIVVSFGSPYLLMDYPTTHTYVSAFGDARYSALPQQAVAQALFGEIPISGKLPVALPGLYPRGQGIAIDVAGSEGKTKSK